MNQDERINILKTAYEHRQREFAMHQINIDNYRNALDIIRMDHSDDPDMQKFAEQLETLLASSLVEQRKEKILMQAIDCSLVPTLLYDVGLTEEAV